MPPLPTIQVTFACRGWGLRPRRSASLPTWPSPASPVAGSCPLTGAGVIRDTTVFRPALVGRPSPPGWLRSRLGWPNRNRIVTACPIFHVAPRFASGNPSDAPGAAAPGTPPDVLDSLPAFPSSSSGSPAFPPDFPVFGDASALPPPGCPGYPPEFQGRWFQEVWVEPRDLLEASCTPGGSCPEGAFAEATSLPVERIWEITHSSSSTVSGSFLEVALDAPTSLEASEIVQPISGPVSASTTFFEFLGKMGWVSLAAAASLDLLLALKSFALLAFAAVSAATVGFILFVTIGVLFQPRWIISFVRKRLPHIVFEYVTRDKLMALTIDDGPNGESTTEILDVLKEHGCKATFFVIGTNVDKWPSLVERMFEEGHEIGNHTMDDVPSWRLPLDSLKMSLLEVDHKLQNYFRTDRQGNRLKWFRPGHGWSTKPMRQLAESHGYRLALGSVFPVDPLFKKSGGPLANYCLWKIYPGAILILHDRPQQANQTVEILRRILPALREQGYQLVTLSEMTQHAALKGDEADETMSLV